MGLLNFTLARPEQGVRATRYSPVIAATDGREQSDAALTVARFLANSPDALRVISVLKTMPVIPEAPAALPADIEHSRREALRRDISAHMLRALNDEVDVEVRDGDAATVIARTAH